jgi:hypothetical protein
MHFQVIPPTSIRRRMKYHRDGAGTVFAWPQSELLQLPGN